MGMSENVAPPGEAVETEPGVLLRRRSFLTVAAAALGVTAGAAKASPLRTLDGPELSFEEFLEECVPVARDLLARDAFEEDRYLYAIASHAVRLAGVTQPELRPSGQGENTYIGGSYGPEPFIVLYWRMDSGARIRAHAHTYGNVVTLGLEGRALVSNYEVEGEPDFDSTEAFDVIRTHEQVLGPGDINVVPLAHDYVHGFLAGSEGASGIDITTRRKERQETPYLQLEDAEGDRFGVPLRARWVK